MDVHFGTLSTRRWKDRGSCPSEHEIGNSEIMIRHELSIIGISMSR
jgi:hypothetical protein